MKQVNGSEYDHWRMVNSWGVVASSDADWYKARRLSLPQDLKDKRTAHMKKLYSDGAPYAWIAKLYKMTRTHVRRIIQAIPNN